MSYENFVPTIEMEHILREREKRLVFAQHCTRKYEGQIKRAGDQITVYVAGSPKVYVLEKDGKYTENGVDYNGNTMKGNVAGSGKDILQEGLPDATTMSYGEVTLRVNKIALFNIKVGDIDELLSSRKDLMGMHRKAIAKSLAIQEDAEIAKTLFNYKDCKASKEVYNGTDKVVASDNPTEGQINVLDLVDNVVLAFNRNDVDDQTKIVCECSPKFWKILKKALRTLGTDNMKLLRKRACYEYNGVYFFKTNVCGQDGKDRICFRTLDATAFFDPKSHIEPYRPHNAFSDNVKGYQLFDCGIVKPKEIITAELKY